MENTLRFRGYHSSLLNITQTYSLQPPPLTRRQGLLGIDLGLLLVLSCCSSGLDRMQRWKTPGITLWKCIPTPYPHSTPRIITKKLPRSPAEEVCLGRIKGLSWTLKTSRWINIQHSGSILSKIIYSFKFSNVST